MRSALFRQPRVLTCTRTAFQATQVDASVPGAQNAMTFTLASLPNYTEFTTLFDHYRINYIDLLWVYSKNTAESNNYTTDKHQMPMLLTAIDKNDAVAMDEASLMQYPSFRVDQLDRPIRRRIYPKPTVAAYSGAFVLHVAHGQPVDRHTESRRAILRLQIHHQVPRIVRDFCAARGTVMLRQVQHVLQRGQVT